jgi:glutathione S-transferase
MDSTVKIYGIPKSRANRCLWMARELGIPFENIPVHFNKTRESPELVAINPNARVPAIDDNGFHLYESMAINLYLARKHGAGKDFVPTSAEDEARTIQWSFWVMTQIEKPLLALLLHDAGRQPLDEALLVKVREDLRRPLDVLEGHLSDRDWLLGERFTVANLNVASVMRWARLAQLDLAAWPRIADWLQRSISRPAFKG